MSSRRADIIVIGAGAIGLAIARRLQMSGRAVIIVEREDAIGRGISARSSEVIHAGIYYPHGSLKARLCTAGRSLLYDYCIAKNIPHRRCGKIILATTSSQLDALEDIRLAAERNGVPLERLDRRALSILEPALTAVAGLLSSTTGIFDSMAFMQALQRDAEHAGAILCLRTEVSAITSDRYGATLSFAGDIPDIECRLVINAAGLDAPALAATHGPAPMALYAKGHYFALRGPSPFSRLVYPLPEPGGLGIHLTLDLSGQARFGPDVQWVERPSYDVSMARAASFYAAIRHYWPNLADGDLKPAYAGVRPKLKGQAASDFLIGKQGRVINLMGIESPGLTASLAIADHVERLASSIN